MAKIVFWSPFEGGNGQTHAILAVSTLMGILHKARALLMHANKDSKKIESAFTPYDQLLASGTLTSSETGVGALIKIIVSNKLSASTIRNYAKPVLKEKLDILYGNVSKEDDQYEQVLENFPLIARRADEIYDLVFIDCPKGKLSKQTEAIIADSDVLVCTVNQDAVKLQNFFEEIESVEAIKDKPKIYLLCDAEDRTKYNEKNIQRRSMSKARVLEIPHNLYFAEACNDGNIIDFLYKNINADSSDYIGNFITNVNEVVEAVIQESKIKDY